MCVVWVCCMYGNVTLCSFFLLSLLPNMYVENILLYQSKQADIFFEHFLSRNANVPSKFYIRNEVYKFWYSCWLKREYNKFWMLLHHKYTNNVIEKKIDGIFNFERMNKKKYIFRRGEPRTICVFYLRGIKWLSFS